MLKFLFLLFCATIISIALFTNHFPLVIAARSHTTAKSFDSITIDKSVHGVATISNLASGNTSVINDDVITLNNLQARDELLKNISSYTDLHKILAKYRNFIGMPAHDVATINDNSSITKAIAVPSRSVVIYYSWDLEKVDRAKYSILMLKFTNISGGLPTKRTDYNILIKNGTRVLFQKNGATFTGTDIKVIGFPVDSDIQINVTRFDGKIVNEYSLLHTPS